MQFANDITPLTLASTAKLRYLLTQKSTSPFTHGGIAMELESRRMEPILKSEREDLEYLQGFISDAKDTFEVSPMEAKEALKTVTELLNRR